MTGAVVGPGRRPVVRTPLRTEWLVLRGRTTTPVVRTGRSRGTPVAGPDLVAGLAGSPSAAVRPGDLVVATEVRGEGATRPSAAAPLLAGALRRAGFTVHEGPVVTSRRVVDGPAERARIAATGALAVDTESALLAHPLGTTAVVRVVVDAPGAPLLSPSLPVRGAAALATLRRTAPVLDQWAAACGEREVVLATPRSFCAGVERAVHTVEAALERFGAPVFVRRQVVHNRHVIERLERRGAVFVEELDEVPEGAVAVLAAHGVAPAVRRQAAERHLRVVDATCPLVAKVHQEVRRFAAADRTVVLIGHADHEEVVGTRGEAADRVLVVADPQEAAAVDVPDPDRVSYVMQTTLAVGEAAETVAVLRRRFPALTGPHSDDICYATTNRQRAVVEVAGETDLVVVVGSAGSSNSRRLVEVVEAAGTPAHLVDDVSEVDLRWLAGARRVGVTAGASAPPHLVTRLVEALGGLGPVHLREHGEVVEDLSFTLPKEVVT